jgi:hypothetical protein
MIKFSPYSYLYDKISCTHKTSAPARICSNSTPDYMELAVVVCVGEALNAAWICQPQHATETGRAAHGRPSRRTCLSHSNHPWKSPTTD